MEIAFVKFVGMVEYWNDGMLVYKIGKYLFLILNRDTILSKETHSSTIPSFHYSNSMNLVGNSIVTLPAMKKKITSKHSLEAFDLLV
jgi:hypothetical protein